MKEIIIIFIAIASFLIAFNYVKKIKQHTKAINQIILMIENVQIYLSYKGLSVNEIFAILTESDLYNDLSFIKEINLNLQSAKSDYILCNDNIRIIEQSANLDKMDKDNIIGFFSVLGKSDINGQIINCETYKEIFKKTLKKLEKTELSNCKTSGTLIIGAGILLIILII